MTIILIILYGISINDILLWESLSHQLVFLVLFPIINFFTKFMVSTNYEIDSKYTSTVMKTGRLFINNLFVSKMKHKQISKIISTSTQTDRLPL